MAAFFKCHKELVLGEHCKDTHVTPGCVHRRCKAVSARDNCKVELGCILMCIFLLAYIRKKGILDCSDCG